MRAEQPFYVLHPLGLDGGQVPPTQIEAMADEYLQSAPCVPARRAVLIGGYCHGGLIAFELARRLRALGERVDFLLGIAPSYGT